MVTSNKLTNTWVEVNSGRRWLNCGVYQPLSALHGRRLLAYRLLGFLCKKQSLPSAPFAETRYRYDGIDRVNLIIN